jgi:hypothetical protein
MNVELCPLKKSDLLQSMQEIETLAEFGLISGQDIPEDLLEVVINSN